MASHDARITWEIQEGGFSHRFYHFWYLTDEKSDANLSFCRMAWAYILALPMGIAWICIGVVMAFVYPFIWLKERNKAKPKKPPVPRETAKEKASKIPDKVSGWAHSISMFFSKIGDWFDRHKKLTTTLRWTLVAIPAIAVSGTLIWLLVWLIAFWHANWNWGVWDWVSITTGSVIGAAVIGLGVGYLLNETIVGDWLFSGYEWTAERSLFPVGRGLKKIGQFFALLYHSTKYRYCPKIVVVKKEVAS